MVCHPLFFFWNPFRILWILMDIELVVLDGADASAAPMIRETIEIAAKVMGVENASCEAYVVSDAFMKKNVLSYPADASFPRPDLDAKRDLGEIYLNPGYIREHGEDLAFMAAHGFLHLLGYDHEGEHDILAMEEKERAIMAALGISGT